MKTFLKICGVIVAIYIGILITIWLISNPVLAGVLGILGLVAWGLYAVSKNAPNVPTDIGGHRSNTRVGKPQTSSGKPVFNYTIIQGDEVVYNGITSDPERRGRQHTRDGKYGDMVVEDTPRSRHTAREIEEERNRSHLSRHGRLPRYNRQV